MFLRIISDLRLSGDWLLLNLGEGQPIVGRPQVDRNRDVLPASHVSEGEDRPHLQLVGDHEVTEDDWWLDEVLLSLRDALVEAAGEGQREVVVEEDLCRYFLLVALLHALTPQPLHPPCRTGPVRSILLVSYLHRLND